MNGTIIQLESLQPLLHMLTDEHLTLIVQQNLGPWVIGIKVHLRQSKGTLALWKPIRNTKFDKIQVWRFSHIFGVFSEDMNFASTLATQLSIYCNNIFIAKYIVCMISELTGTLNSQIRSISDLILYKNLKKFPLRTHEVKQKN